MASGTTAFWFVVAVVYLIPSLIAIGGTRRHAGLIVFVSLVSSWTVIGWLGTLIWAVVAPRKRSRVRAEMIVPLVQVACDSCNVKTRIRPGEVRACPNCATGFLRAYRPLALHENLDDFTDERDTP